MSDPRNPNLIKMFQLLGLGERAGSGFQKILRAWHEQSWLVPLVAEDSRLETTRVSLPVVSMIPAHVEKELQLLVGTAYPQLDELSRMILIMAHHFGDISNEDVQQHRKEHPRDIGARLAQLVSSGWLNKDGVGRGTRYRWPTTPVSDLLPGVTTEVTTEVTTQVTTQVTPEVRLIHVLRGDMGRRELMEALQLKNGEHFRTHYLKPAFAKGWLEMTQPDKPNSRFQKYRLTQLGIRERQK